MIATDAKSKAHPLRRECQKRVYAGSSQFFRPRSGAGKNCETHLLTDPPGCARICIGKVAIMQFPKTERHDAIGRHKDPAIRNDNRYRGAIRHGNEGASSRFRCRSGIDELGADTKALQRLHTVAISDFGRGSRTLMTRIWCVANEESATLGFRIIRCGIWKTNRNPLSLAGDQGRLQQSGRCKKVRLTIAPR